jgi:hypothetical protein
MYYMPPSQPKMVTPGTYEAEIIGDAIEKTSTFDADKVYFLIPLLLHGKSGEPVRFSWAVPPNADLYTAALKAIGGRTDSTGAVSAPLNPEGRRFKIVIAKAFKKDGKEKREVVAVEPLGGAPLVEEPADDGPDPLDEAAHHKGSGGDDDVPF